MSLLTTGHFEHLFNNQYPIEIFKWPHIYCLLLNQDWLAGPGGKPRQNSPAHSGCSQVGLVPFDEAEVG